MRSKKIPTVLSFFRRGLKNSEQSSYGWYNMGRAITEEEIDDIETFVEKHPQIDLCCVISGISPMRPQRTWGDMPEWIRGADEYYEGYEDDGTFIFMWWGEEEYSTIEKRHSFISDVSATALEINASYRIIKGDNYEG